MTQRASYFVLMMHGQPGQPAAVLTTTPVTLASARSSVSWQTGGANRHPTYPICIYDPATRQFVEIEGECRRLSIHRGPYTEAAYAEFLASLPTA